MKAKRAMHYLAIYMIVVGTALALPLLAKAQGTITFNGAASFSGTNYYESGMWFHVVIPQGGPYYDDMAGLPAILGPSNVPSNNTPYMVFLRQYNPYDYVALSLTNGSTFGLASASLADPNSPSLSPVAITFVGFKRGGSAVTNTFTTPGNGAYSLLNYQFTSAFAFGLSAVEIYAPRWAMDNLVFMVPEPSSAALVSLGLLALVLRRRGPCASCAKAKPPRARAASNR